MKKLLLVLLAIASIGATSCKKCKDCTVTIKQNGSVVGTSTAEYCDDDLKEVDGTTVTQTVPDGQGGTFTQQVIYTCN